MKKYSLNIAGYIISFESADSGPDLMPSRRFLRNICKDCISDVHITVHSDPFYLPSDAERVFHAPFVEEINGIQVKTSDTFWSVYKRRSDLFIKTTFPLSGTEKEGILKFSLTTRKWDIYIKEAGNGTDPLEYPLDGLILYYLTVIHGDIMIHASGVDHAGHGYLFSGVSGKGKSTMAGLWNSAGVRVIHDDRLIVRKFAGAWKMFNTPVYNDDVPRESPLSRIFLIEHGTENKFIPVKGASAVSLVLANCIQHSWNPEIIA
ncbi:MAG: hypothetical protein C0408_10740, partial [Odoribacter sp.]|nr:hypothetical protein [Odoribacter sp.]